MSFVRFDPWDENALAATMLAVHEALDDTGPDGIADPDLARRILTTHLLLLGYPQDLEGRTEIAQEPQA